MPRKREDEGGSQKLEVKSQKSKVESRKSKAKSGVVGTSLIVGPSHPPEGEVKRYLRAGLIVILYRHGANATGAQ